MMLYRIFSSGKEREWEDRRHNLSNPISSRSPMRYC
jgi:hypothetical protein